MEGQMRIFAAAEERLDRKLTEQEVNFLKWLYEKHLNDDRRKQDHHKQME